MSSSSEIPPKTFSGEDTPKLLDNTTASLPPSIDSTSSAHGNDNPSTQLEQTIKNMQESNICGHPQHFHSFQQVNFSFFPGNRICSGCQGRIQSVVLFGNNNTVVRCIACGALAHRSCGLSSSGNQRWNEVCPVNAPHLSTASRKNSAPGAVQKVDSTTEIQRKTDHSFEEISRRDSTEEELIEFEMDENTQIDSVLLEDNAFFKSTASDDEDDERNEHLHHSSHPFTAVARALQENVIAHFQKQQERAEDHSYTRIEQTDDDEQENDESSRNSNPLSQLASGAVQVIKNLPPGAPAVVAGGIAGGVAGLVMAGPAGAYAGAQVGKVAGALGALAEGGVTVGVFVASVATASITAQQIQEQIKERHVLAMGEEGTSRKVLLVRPNIQIDPVWDEIVLAARKDAPREQHGGLGALFSLSQPSVGMNRERYRRDSDIVRTDENEIPTNEKVLLLVSRILNDKSSLPGHMYRHLIQAFQDRCAKATKQVDDGSESLPSNPVQRSRRDDAHAVIKHVAGTLLEVRPELSSSPEVTELTAAAVEGLVFGQIYPFVLEEIVRETSTLDADLVEKAKLFREETASNSINTHEELLSDANISEGALEALNMLPDCHSAVDKLYFCVRFLELISDHLSSSIHVCADSLLKMVCQHLIVFLLRNFDAGVSKRMHAEVAFLEEFARDEQLLRGREGYALVTLQAACHFLDSSSDFEKDIFGSDEEEPISTELSESTTLISIAHSGDE